MDNKKHLMLTALHVGCLLGLFLLVLIQRSALHTPKKTTKVVLAQILALITTIL